MMRFAVRALAALASLALLVQATPLTTNLKASEAHSLHDLDDVFRVEKGGLTFHGSIRKRDLAIHNNAPFQPYPDHITAEYHVYGRVYKFDMKLQPGFVDPDVGYTEYKTEEGEVYRVWHEERHYMADNGQAKISALVFGEESIHAIVYDYTNGETFNLESLDYSSVRLPENKRRDLADTKVIAYRATDLKYKGETCGTTHEHNVYANLGKMEGASDELRKEYNLHKDLHEFGNSAANGAGKVAERLTRRQVSSAYSPPPRATATACSTVISVARAVTVNFAVDWTYYSAYSNDATAVANSVNSILLSSNFVYVNQYNVKLTLGTLIAGTTKGSYTWSSQTYTSGSRCATTINTALTTLASWVANQPNATSTTKRIANWHQLTDCYPAPGTVGLAYVGTTCGSVSTSQGATNTGVSSLNGASTWLTVAHELGHNFNGDHAFDDGQGTTGGIMDYGDGLYPVSGTGRTYRFHPTYNEAEMCTYLNSMLSISNCYSLAAAAVCGNGVVETGEECDDTSSCCNTATCKLASGATCTGSTTCCQSCQAKGSDTKCTPSGATVANGFCMSGSCSSSACASVSGGPYTYCPVTSANASTTDPCATSTCALTSDYLCQWTVSSGLPDGASCYVKKSGVTTQGVCVSSVCTAVAATTPTASASVATTPTATPSGTRSPSITPSVTPTKSVSPSPLAAGASPSNTPSVSASPAVATPTPTPAASPSPSVSPAAAVTTSNGWNIGTWSVCSPVNTCGTAGSQTRTVVCKISDITVTDTICTTFYGTKPSTSVSCTTTDPCTYTYYTTNGTCSSTTCGVAGTIPVTVSCLQIPPSGSQSSVDLSYCSSLPAVTTSYACTGECTDTGSGSDDSGSGSGGDSDTGDTGDGTGSGTTYTSTWVSTPFSACDAYCGSGQMSRQVVCSGAEESACDPALKPATIATCSSDPCDTPLWINTGAYTTCNNSATVCSQFSEEIYECRILFSDVSYQKVSESRCSSNKPISKKTLCPARASCSQNSEYYYVYADVAGTTCYDNCPNSYTVREIFCYENTTNSITDTENCVESGVTPLVSWTDKCISKNCLSSAIIEEPKTDAATNIGLIIGATVGAAVAAGLAGALAFFIYQRRMKKQEEEGRPMWKATAPFVEGNFNVKQGDIMTELGPEKDGRMKVRNERTRKTGTIPTGILAPVDKSRLMLAPRPKTQYDAHAMSNVAPPVPQQQQGYHYYAQ